MALATLYTRAVIGVEAPLITVEVHLSGGLPHMAIVGMAETAVKESKDRVRSALLNAQFDFPASRITINLAPADLPKGGGRYDLAIALGILVASGQIPAAALRDTEVMGELSLSGKLRPVQGVLPAAMAAQKAGRTLLLPAGNAPEIGLLANCHAFAADHLLELCGHLKGQAPLSPVATQHPQTVLNVADMTDIKGQPQARKALEVAAAGGHNLLFFGPPGTGKTLLASRLPGILPELSPEEALDVAAIRSIIGQPILWGQRPFRAPHHTCSGAALVGGGSVPRPGEITLAHNGVLFLDELTEFSRATLDVLREPLESGEIVISRAARKTTFPARFQLVAAMNPTPGGFNASDSRSRAYTPEQLQRYLSRLSGPFLDRIDLYVEVPTVPAEVLQGRAQGESSAEVRARVQVAWERQQARQGKQNRDLTSTELHELGMLPQKERQMIVDLAERFRLSARAQHRIEKVALTLADLAGADEVAKTHLIEALNMRQLDRLGVMQ
ncbi:YifB family Mg chelatase-like AAA ATPase [Salinispirillum sp. LH 10-3-1]|uniref:YifB family Mg chelatase-like AAA ATPase n=1 Tax=Salinispirillum sp. LH 10-3-1 TaxID=2952525 RepID=A0AB38YG77_9GAMM